MNGSAVRVSAADIGRRVVVRYRVAESGMATDALGQLADWADGALHVRRADGELVVVPVDAVIAAKRIPARPVARREVRALEAAAALGWRALEVDHVGGWLLRAAGGFTGRANSCLPLSSPGMPLSDAIAVVERWYAARGLRPAFQLPHPLAGQLDAALSARGWPAPDQEVLVLTAQVTAAADALREDLPRSVIAGEPDDAWLGVYRGGDLPPAARQLLGNADVVAFASIDVSGRRVAIGRGAVTAAPDGTRWLGITAVEVVPEARRRGYGSHITAALARWAAKHEATGAYVQVAGGNTVAAAAYERIGFTEHHRYHYRRRP
ncbi:MAG: GNAT family N-acetyltransferase [Jiangellaceae bacterium]|nr:GNAT family N-acetyltransferase [Jiangellaceae bacterium]